MSNVLDNVVGTYRVVYAPANIDTTVEGFTPLQIKAQLAGAYKELENATVKIEGNVVTFVLPSGQKNV